MVARVCYSHSLKMAALVSSLIPHLIVTKTGKEMAGKNESSCVLSLIWEKRSFPGTPQQNSPQMSLARTRSYAQQ